MSALGSFIYRFEQGAAPAAPTLLLLHGTGGSEHDLLPLGATLLPTAHRLSPRGRVLEHGMPRFFRRLAEGVFDMASLHAETAALAEWVRAARAAHGLERSPMVAVGYSNGANIASSLLLSGTGVLDGAVLLRGMVPFTPEPLPALDGRAVLMLSGTHDPIMRPGEADALESLFARAGARVTRVDQRAGHGLVQGDVTEAQRWLAEQFAGAGAV